MGPDTGLRGGLTAVPQLETCVSLDSCRKSDRCLESDDLVKYEVVSCWDTGQVLDEIMETESVAILRAMISRSSSPYEVATIRFRIGQLMAKEHSRRKREIANLLVSLLSQWAVHCQVHAPANHDTVMSATFYIFREVEEEFVDCLRKLAFELSPGQKLVWSGTTVRR